MFKDYVTGKEKIKDFMDKVHEDRIKFLNSLKDPMLFYKIDEDHYKLLKVWGKSFVLYRRILGFITENTFRIKFLILMFFGLYLYLADKIYDLFIINSRDLFEASYLFLNVCFAICFLIIFFGISVAKQHRKYSLKRLCTKSYYNNL
jgi:hypothetical protein